MKIILFTPQGHGYASLKKMFEQHGVEVDIARTLERCTYLSMTDTYAAVVALHLSPQDLQIYFPKWKAEGCSSLFVVVSDNQSGVERARCLEMGIDRYYIEPYSYSKLISDITLNEYRSHLKERQSLKTGLFEVDILSRSILLRGELLPLTRTEFELLTLLIRRRGMVLSRVQIWEQIWGNREYPLANTIDVHMNRLRRKLEQNGVTAIRTIHGIGYRLYDES